MSETNGCTQKYVYAILPYSTIPTNDSYVNSTKPVKRTVRKVNNDNIKDCEYTFGLSNLFYAIIELYRGILINNVNDEYTRQ